MDLPLSVLYSPRLSHFINAYHHRNLHSAAEVLNISQPALSKSLKSLEKQIGVTLFTRSKKGMKPTAAANILFDHIEKMSDLSRITEVALSEHSNAGEGLIKIGAGQMWSWLFIPEVVAKFKQAFPATRLEITTGPMPELVDQLLGKHLDVVVGDFHGINVTAPYKMEQVWSSEFWAFAGSDHKLVSRDNIELAELVEYSWSGYIDHDVFEQKISTMCSKNNLQPPSITIKASSLATLFKLTKDSNNILVLPNELEAEAAKAGLIPLQSDNLSLWSIDTGSIIDSAKSSIEHYKLLLSLIYSTGSQSANLMTKEK